MSEKIKRKLLAIFLNTGTAATPVWSLMGDGITEQTINYNPQTSDETYVHQDSGTSEVESYKPTIATPQTAMRGDPVFEFVDNIRRNRAVLADAITEVLLVYLYEDATEGAYPAEKNSCAVSINDFGGAGGESAKINYDILLRGDSEKGTFSPATGEFTPAV